MEILEILLLVILFGITIIALFGALSLLLPALIEKTRRNLEVGLGRSFLLGLVNFIFFFLLVIALFWLSQNSVQVVAGFLIFLAGGILLALAIFSLLGLTAVANLLGDRMGVEKPRFCSNLRGGALLLLSGLAPYVGWFIFTPLVLWAGFGAAISTLFRRREKAQSTEAVV